MQQLHMAMWNGPRANQVSTAGRRRQTSVTAGTIFRLRARSCRRGSVRCVGSQARKPTQAPLGLQHVLGLGSYETA